MAGSKKSTAAGSKTLLTALALLGTFGGWAYLAGESIPEQVAATPQVRQLDLPPIPTLVPTPGINLSDLEPVQAEPTKAPPVLRQVSQPASVGSSGRSGGGGSAATTRSSQ
jgi:hypothetical protein